MRLQAVINFLPEMPEVVFHGQIFEAVTLDSRTYTLENSIKPS